MPAIESDLFLVRDAGQLVYHDEQLLSLVAARLERNRPVLVEGLRVLSTLRRLRLDADFLVWVEREGREVSQSFEAEVGDYLREFQPRQRADFVFSVPAID
jgi:chlorite dismutase